MALLEPFANLWQLIPRGLPGWSSLLLEQQVLRGSLAGRSLYCSVCQALAWLTRVLLYCFGTRHKGPSLGSLYWSAASAGEERKATVMPPPLRMTPAVSPHPMAAWLSSKHSPMIFFLTPPAGHLPAVSSRPPLGLLSHPYGSSSQLLHIQGTCVPVRVHRAAARIVRVVLAPFRLSQISCCTRQQSQVLLLCPKQLSRYGDLTLLQFPTAQVQQVQSCSPSSLFPSSLVLQVLRGSICSFLVVRISCLFSAGVLHLGCIPDAATDRDGLPLPAPEPSASSLGQVATILLSIFLINSPNIKC